MVELLREDPGFADEYLAASLDALDEPGGREALLMALRQVAKAEGKLVRFFPNPPSNGGNPLNP
jgi:hypothetical protein